MLKHEDRVSICQPQAQRGMEKKMEAYIKHLFRGQGLLVLKITRWRESITIHFIGSLQILNSPPKATEPWIEGISWKPTRITWKWRNPQCLGHAWHTVGAQQIFSETAQTSKPLFMAWIRLSQSQRQTYTFSWDKELPWKSRGQTFNGNK